MGSVIERHDIYGVRFASSGCVHYIHTFPMTLFAKATAYY